MSWSLWAHVMGGGGCSPYVMQCLVRLLGHLGLDAALLPQRECRGGLRVEARPLGE